MEFAFAIVSLIFSICKYTDSTDSRGRHFIVTVPPVYRSREFECMIYITSNDNGHVVVKKHEDSIITMTANYIISPGGFYIQFAGSSVHQKFTGKQTNAIDISADVDIAVYVAAYRLRSPAMFTALPTSILSTRYGILSYPPSNRDNLNYNYVIVTSLTDNNHIHISNIANNSINVTLNVMESFNLRTRLDSSGARITSRHPVNVVVDSSCSDIPVNISSCDTIYDSPLPMEFWGQNFIIPPLTPKAGYIVRILAPDEDSVVALEIVTGNNTTTSTIIFKHMYELQFGTSVAVITANNTITVVQYGLGKSFDSLDGDPFLTSVPSVEHFSYNYTFPSPFLNGDFTNRIAITIENKYIDELKLDGQRVTSLKGGIKHKVPAPYGNYRVLVLTLNNGYHRLQHSVTDAKYSVLLYGLKRGNGFGVYLGLSVYDDECKHSPCKNNANCTDMIRGYECNCITGYHGEHCEIDIDECASSPCHNNGVCTDNVNGYTCSCASGYDGVNCKIDIDECRSNPCQNGAKCIDYIGNYNCTCLTGFYGFNCEHVPEIYERSVPDASPNNISIAALILTTIPAAVFLLLLFAIILWLKGSPCRKKTSPNVEISEPRPIDLS